MNLTRQIVQAATAIERPYAPRTAGGPLTLLALHFAAPHLMTPGTGTYKPQRLSRGLTSALKQPVGYDKPSVEGIHRIG